MQSLQDRPRQTGIGQAFIEDRDIRINDKDDSKILIKNSNSVSLLEIIKIYKINIDDYNGMCICPFPFHSNERTPSFKYYKDTNSFYCFGCKSGGGPVNFISFIEKISVEDAAKKILNKFKTNDNIIVNSQSNFIDRHNMFLAFSNLIRNFIFDNLDDMSAITYADKVCLIFDTINDRHQLDNDGLRLIIDNLSKKIKNYNI